MYGIPYSFQHIARLEKAGKFPKRIKLGQNRVAWLSSAIVEWIENRIEETDFIARQLKTARNTLE